ncbi:hypothetical protein BDV93DRAFT_526324 [Ceratobasidium sp. AG-I]|nr:hypothetical protein BDV93DRAFT_526324 [Ceratobasidium sp. AG-I]
MIEAQAEQEIAHVGRIYIEGDLCRTRPQKDLKQGQQFAQRGGSKQNGSRTVVGLENKVGPVVRGCRCVGFFHVVITLSDCCSSGPGLFV